MVVWSGGETITYIFIDKYLGGACCLRGFLFGRWKLGKGVVLLRFLRGWFRAFFLKRFIG